MPVPEFEALFEVFAETFGLCVACVVGASFGFKCAVKQNGGPILLSGLGASLLTVLFCLYGKWGLCYIYST